MQYLTFSKEEKSKYPICLLVNKIRKDLIQREFIEKQGIDPEDLIVISLHQTKGKKKTPKAEMVAYIQEELTPVFEDMGVQYVLVSDSEYFKTLAKVNKAEAYLGYVLPSAYGPQNVIYTAPADAVFYDPEKVRAKIDQACSAMKAHIAGTYRSPGVDIIHSAEYPDTVEVIKQWLDTLLISKKPLACDIEGFSLKHYSAGIGTITFCWDQHNGIAFPVDFLPPEEAVQVRALLRDFFTQFDAPLIFHKIDYDVKVLIYQLFMKDILDTEGLLFGLSIMMRNWHDTRIISYLATNSCSGNRLGLKDQAQEFSGNYAVEEINDIRKIPLPELLQYNLVDGLSTWYVFNKHWDTVIADNQLEVYNSLFKPAMLDIIQMGLTGMPIDMERVKEVRVILEADTKSATDRIMSSSLVQQFNYQKLEDYVAEKNATWKKKRTTVAETIEAAKENEKIREDITLNPNSGPQLIKLLFDVIGLPVLGLTDSGLPSTEGDILKALKNHTTNQEVIDLLDALIDFKAVFKILTSTLVHMEEAQLGPDGWHYLFGDFNLGGTVSGRLSSSGPNLQNLPASGTRYAKLIKSCFKAPPGWFFCGIDFASLEDRISALTTKDPNKLKVYTDGYDGHCLRAHAYFGDQMSGIIDGNVKSINSIADLYPDLRQESKAPTFALTYQGTYMTLMTNCGFPEAKAKDVERKYHVLYKVSDDWVDAKLQQASKDGYVTIAFGLRLRTPLLAQVIRGTKKTPHEANAEGRTAGNALGQSWCLLNSRAGSEFMGKVRKSKHRLDIRPCAQIHDAQYFLIRDHIEVVSYVNIHIVSAVQWQNHPDIMHPDVKLGGEFSIFYPDWSKEAGIPNNATEDEIRGAFQKHLEKISK